MKKVVIIGGGITGLSTAWKLSENNFEVNILESDQFIGGLAKTVDIGNYKVDLGPHSFLSEDKEIFNKVKTCMNFFYIMLFVPFLPLIKKFLPSSKIRG